MAGALRLTLFILLFFLQTPFCRALEDCIKFASQQCQNAKISAQNCFASKSPKQCASQVNSCINKCEIEHRRLDCTQRMLFTLADQLEKFCLKPQLEALETPEDLQKKLEAHRDQVIQQGITEGNVVAAHQVMNGPIPETDIQNPYKKTITFNDLKPSVIDQLFVKKNGPSDSPAIAKSPDQVSGSGNSPNAQSATGSSNNSNDGNASSGSTSASSYDNSNSAAPRYSETTKNSQNNNSDSNFSPTIGSSSNITPGIYQGKTETAKNSTNAGYTNDNSSSRLGGFVGASSPNFNLPGKSNSTTPILTGNFNPQFHTGSASGARSVQLASSNRMATFSRQNTSALKKKNIRKTDSFDKILSMFNAKRSMNSRRTPASSSFMSEYCNAGIDIGQHTILSNAEQFFNKQNLQENGELSEEIIPSKPPASCK